MICAMDAGFKFLPRFADAGFDVGSSVHLGPQTARAFDGDTMSAKLARAVCRADCLPVKEFFESVEFFSRVRRKLRSAAVADLCCGHGFTGILFALFEPRVETVFLVDRKRPAAHEAILDAVADAFPWVRDKVDYREITIRGARGFLPRRTSVVAIHACGNKTDHCIDLGIRVDGSVAVMPCCYSRRRFQGSPALDRALGIATAFDIHRTYRLEQAGYRVRWEEVPGAITDMSRILMATKGSSFVVAETASATTPG